LSIREDAEENPAIYQPQHVMSGSGDIGKIRFACEVMTRSTAHLIIAGPPSSFPKRFSLRDALIEAVEKAFLNGLLHVPRNRVYLLEREPQFRPN